MEQEAKTERKSCRFTKSENEIIESKMKNTSLSFSDLVVKEIVNNKSESEIIDTINWECELITDNIKANSKDINENINKNIENILREIKANKVEVEQKSLFKYFAELTLTNEAKANIDTYKKGDIIRTSKNHVLIILSTDKEKCELKATLAPLLSDTKFTYVNLKIDSEKVVSVYRQ